jgi:hypothetical protein
MLVWVVSQGFNVFGTYGPESCNAAAGANENAYCLGMYTDTGGKLAASYVSRIECD